MPPSETPSKAAHAAGYWSPRTWERRAAENVVTPFDINHLSKGGGYELRMGREAFTTAEAKRIDLSGDRKDVEIPPGHFALLLTKERVKIPRDSIGFISVKFKHKAKGLINVSGFHVDPGYDGWLTFSVFNAGPRSITVARDSFCFLLWLAHFDEPVGDAYLYPSGTVDARGSMESLDDRMVDDLKGEFCSPMSLKQQFEDLKARHAKDLDEHTKRLEKRRWIWTVVAFLLGLIGPKAVDVGWDWLSGSRSPSPAGTGVSTVSPPTSTTPPPAKAP